MYISETDAVDIPAGSGFAEANSLITTIAAQNFAEFQLKRDLSSFTNTITREADNSTLYNAHTISAVFLESATENEALQNL